MSVYRTIGPLVSSPEPKAHTVGELIVYEGIGRPSDVRRPSVNIFKRHLL